MIEVNKAQKEDLVKVWHVSRQRTFGLCVANDGSEPNMPSVAQPLNGSFHAMDSDFHAMDSDRIIRIQTLKITNEF